MWLTIALTKISPTHHRFEYHGENGAGESLELETKTFLFHDLLHFAVETEAKLQNSFYGLLAKSKNYASLSETPEILGFQAHEIAVTERVVGALTSVIKGSNQPDRFILMMENMLEATQEPLPSWLTQEFVIRVQERMRKLLGQWHGTPFGKTMELTIEIL